MKKIIALTLALVMSLALFAGCSKEEAPAKTPAVTEVYDKMVEKIGADNMSASMDADKDTLSTFYYVNADDIDSYVLKFPLMNVQAEEYFVAKVKEGKMDAVKEGIAKRQADLDAQWKNYLPEQYELVQKAQTIVNGDYVLFTVSMNADKAVEAFNEMTK